MRLPIAPFLYTSALLLLIAGCAPKKQRPSRRVDGLQFWQDNYSRYGFIDATPGQAGDRMKWDTTTYGFNDTVVERDSRYEPTASNQWGSVRVAFLEMKHAQTSRAYTMENYTALLREQLKSHFSKRPDSRTVDVGAVTVLNDRYLSITCRCLVPESTLCVSLVEALQSIVKDTIVDSAMKHAESLSSLVRHRRGE